MITFCMQIDLYKGPCEMERHVFWKCAVLSKLLGIIVNGNVSDTYMTH